MKDKISIDEYKNANAMISRDDYNLIWFRGDKEFYMVQKSRDGEYTVLNTIPLISSEAVDVIGEMLNYTEHLKSQDDFNKYMYKSEFDTGREFMDEWKE